MTSLYELLIPLLSADPALKWPKIIQYHESNQEEIESGQEPTWQVVPKEGEIYLVYSQTMGWPVDSNGDQINPTTDAGFTRWQDPNLRTSTAYVLGSIINHPMECWIEVEVGNPLQFKFFNTTGSTVLIDLTIWMFVVKEGQWNLVRAYLQKKLQNGDE